MFQLDVRIQRWLKIDGSRRRRLILWGTGKTIVIALCLVVVGRESSTLSGLGMGNQELQSTLSKERYTLASQLMKGVSSSNPSSNTFYRDRIHKFFGNFNEKIVLTVDERNTTIWLEEYLLWHNDMRQQFPGHSIFTHPDAPKTAVHYVATQFAGGLHDRLANIPESLQLCHEERRVLFIKWFKAPTELEEFLEPNLLNWTLPYHPLYTSNVTALEELIINITDPGKTTTVQREEMLSKSRIRPITRA